MWGREVINVNGPALEDAGPVLVFALALPGRPRADAAGVGLVAPDDGADEHDADAQDGGNS